MQITKNKMLPGYYRSRIKAGIFLCFLVLLLPGCSHDPEVTANGQKWQEDWTKIGLVLGVDAPQEFTLQDHKEALAADGLYYATWVTGDCVPYKNSEGEMADLYDAQVYLLAKESKDESSAKEYTDTLLAAAEKNYEIQGKETATCDGQNYTLVTYDCIGKDTPYDRGASALATYGTWSVCIELTCTKDYHEDLVPLLTKFLNGCHYIAR